MSTYSPQLDRLREIEATKKHPFYGKGGHLAVGDIVFINTPLCMEIYNIRREDIIDLRRPLKVVTICPPDENGIVMIAVLLLRYDTIAKPLAEICYIPPWDKYVEEP